MSKVSKILSYVLLLAIFSTCCFTLLSVETPSGADNQNDKMVNDSMIPKSSGYTITEKWNYTSSGIDDVKISLDGNYVAICQNTWNNLTLFHKDSNNTLWNTDIIPNSINSFDISADGKYISVGNTGSAYLFNNTEATPAWSKTFMWKFSTILYAPVQVAISGDGKYTAWVKGTALYLLDNTLKSSKWFYSGSSVINAADIGYNPIQNRYYIAIGDQAGNVTLFDDTSNVPLWWNETGNPINSLKISDDGSHILAKVGNDKVYFFDNTIEPSKSALWTYPAPNANYRNIDISADGKNVIIVEEPKVHYLNSTLTDPKQQEWEALSDNDIITEGAVSGDGKYILLGGSIGMINPDGVVELYNSTNKLPKAPDWKDTKLVPIDYVAINGFGNYFAFVEDYYILRFYHHDVPLPRAIAASSGGGGDDDDEEAAIPFGNYYLVFACVAIISLVVTMKRKVIFKA